MGVRAARRAARSSPSGRAALVNLSITPSLSTLVRWRSYRYVLRQSLGFFQNDYAGRISQKVMQTGMALRESVVNVIDGVWYLLVYLVGTIAHASPASTGG